ncbi:transcription factor Ouib isoform X2 [Drosophila ficusphila]|uniref:transcription factor Ouib isoform X2 n=1 Tax=Drosophila ficusphila TaxID=30025 RepID=UPI0007E72B91|nr:transcription factor Ouib isoform X2 [Drosophila ficusphila]
MSLHCRSCGKIIYSQNPLNIFEGTRKIVKKFALLTGIWLTDQLYLPKNICACCHVSLNRAIAFRELCIKTNNILSNQLETPETKEYEDLANILSDRGGSDTSVEDDQDVLWKEQKDFEEEEIYRAYMEEMERGQDSCVGYIQEQDELYDTSEDDIDSNGDSMAASIVETTRQSVEKEEVSHSPQSNYVRSKKRQQGKSKGAKIYFCDQCGRQFNDKGNLNLHLVRHSGVRPFQCPECDRREFSTYLLKIHIRVKHRGEKPFACKFCDERFVNSTKRTRHQTMHGNKVINKTHTCLHCGICFESKSHLKIHEVVHSGERNFHCEICNMSFTRSFNLKTHFRSKQHRKKVVSKIERKRS